jgi:hypothetical protein
MPFTHDIFLELPCGGRMWVASARNLKHAKECLKTLALTAPGVYLVYDLRSKQQVTLPEENDRSMEWLRWVSPICALSAWLRRSARWQARISQQ